MEMNSRHLIKAPRDKVWEALNDPAVIGKCIPGCESLQRSDEGELLATVVLRIGPVKATFKGKVRFENVVAPVSLTLAGEGSGGIAGHARGSADVTLEDLGDTTALTYSAQAQIGGKIAQLGARLIQSTSQKLAAQFFESFEREMTAQPVA